MAEESDKGNPNVVAESSVFKSDDNVFIGCVSEDKATKSFESSAPPSDPRSSSVQNVFQAAGTPTTSAFLAKSSIPDTGSTKSEKHPVACEPHNVFENVGTTASSFGSASFQSRNLFGGKTDSTASQQSLFGKPSSVSPALFKSTELKSQSSIKAATDVKVTSVFGLKVADSKLISIPSKQTTTHSSLAFGAPAPVFSTHSKKLSEKKDSNLFGGKQDQQSVVESFPFSSKVFSLTQSDQRTKKRVSDSDAFKKPINISKPSLVFSSKFATESPKEKTAPVLSAPETSEILSSSSFPSAERNISKPGFEELPSKAMIPLKESTTLIAVDIPSTYLDKSVLHNHFSKFGDVRRVLINKKSNQASIYFSDHQAAAEAKVKGRKLHPLIPEMKLFFGAQPQPRKTASKVASDQSTSEPYPAHRKMILDKRSSGLKVATTTAASLSASTTVKYSLPQQQKLAEKASSTSGAVKEKSKFSGLPKTEFRSKAPSSNFSSVKEASVLMKLPAKNNYDRYLVLDARDKNMRSKQTKVVDVKKAHYLSATCPDMCPEKERYSRDIQYDVSIYEMTNDEIDHRLSVKKFSRSSADKDEPLPHELRPGPVLKMTMDFLTCNIIAKGDENEVQIDLWYNYLCNRTRGLRNDITQQHLLDHNAVYVLERCTRFHVHCSHHLCEEPVDNFDAKINMEHLTKSLQSLKELYHDMGEKGFYYDTEAEFRAYEILLCINDGNVIFKYLKFRDAVRNSQEVQFAVEVLHSIHSSNYVRFFRLLKRASYLQACIMHKYFNNVRQKAINIIARAYSAQLIPVEKAMNMLGYSDLRNFKKYIKYFGITLNEESRVVVKSKYSPEPEIVLPVSKSQDIIEAKKTLSIGEIIHGDALPENPLPQYKPHNSFDPVSGILRKSAWDSSDQTVTLEQQRPSLEVEERERFLQQTEVDELQKELFMKVGEMQRLKILRRCFDRWKTFVVCTREKKRKDAEAVRMALKCAKIWRMKSAWASDMRRKADVHILSKFMNKWKDYARRSKEIKACVLKSKVVQQRILMRKMIKLWKRNSHIKKSEREVKKARAYLLCRKYSAKWRNYTKECLAYRMSGLFFATKLLRSYFGEWRHWCAVKIAKKKMYFESFPATGSQLSPEEQNRLLDWSYERESCLNLSASQIAELDMDIHLKSRKQFSLQHLSGIVAWSPLPLMQRFQADVKSKPLDLSGNIFNRCIKFLIVVYPDTDMYLLEWVRTKFNLLEIECLDTPLQFVAQFMHNEKTYSVIVSEKEFKDTSIHNLDGASAIILLSNEDKLIHLQRFVSRLDDIPCLIICKARENEFILKDQWLLTKEAIDDSLTSEKFFNYIFNLWQTRGKSCNIQVSSCSTLVRNFITEQVLAPLYRLVNQKSLYSESKHGADFPAKLVSLYNAAIDHVSICFNAARTSRASDWPPSELLGGEGRKLWNEDDGRVVMAAIRNALLPSFCINTASSNIELLLMNYVTDVVNSDAWGGNLLSEIRKIIAETRKRARLLTGDDVSLYQSSFESTLFSSHSESSIDLCFSDLPWVDILSCCIYFKLSLLPEIKVAFESSKLKDFNPADRITELDASYETRKKEKEETPSCKRKVSFLELYSKTKKQKQSSTSQLLSAIQQEKKEAFEYESQLKSLMEAEEELQHLFPGYQDALTE